MKKLSLMFLMILALLMQAAIGLRAGARADARVSSLGPLAQTTATTGATAAIVELESEPVIVHEQAANRLLSKRADFDSLEAQTYEAQLDIEHASFKARAGLVSPALRVRTELRRLANAVSIEANPTDIAAISTLPGVKRVELVKRYVAMLDASVPLINAPAMWERLGGSSNAGQGMKIAILDTGIDITNPLFSDAGFVAPPGFPRSNKGNDALANNKVIVAKSFLSSDRSAMDQQGHGTNCAGIAAGDAGTQTPLGPIAGVAPQAYLGNYRVLDSDGNGATDLIGNAIDEAVSDRFDVISMSLGSSDPPTASGFLEDIVEHAVTSGVTVVIAAGNNDGALVGQSMTIRSPAIAPSAITVGASTNSHVVGPAITVDEPAPVDPSLIKIGSLNGDTVAVDDSLKSLPYAYVDPQGRGCGSLPAGSLTGKVALIERGVCAFADKVNNAAAAGARAVIIFNKDISEGSDGGDTLINIGVSNTHIPSMFVPRSAGLALRDFVIANPSATLSISPIGETSVPSDVQADFSAVGPSVLEGLKPDVSAPGVIIYSGAVRSSPSTKNPVVDPSGFLAISGTSQATPHVAGAAALVKQLNPSFTPEQIKSALISSATTDVFTTSVKTTTVGVLNTGGGRIDLAKAGSVTATFSPPSLSFGIKKLKQKNVNASIDLKLTSLIDGQNTFTLAVQQLDPGDGITVTTPTPSLSLTKGQSGTATITVSAVVGSQRRDYTGYVLITGGGQTLHVPYWVRFVKKKT
jgi:subtilisin family serine protease